MGGRDDYLFSRAELREVLDAKKKQIEQEIDGYQKDYILSVSPEDLADHIEDKYRYQAPALRANDACVVNHGETKIDVSHDRMRWIDDRSKPFYINGTFVEFSVPFDGDADLFQYRTSTFNFSPPVGRIAGREIRLKYETLNHNPEEIKAEFLHDLGEINQWLGWVAQQITPYNSSLRGIISGRIETRRTKYLADQGLVAALGFPVKRRDDAPQTYAVPVVKKRVVVLKPTTTAAPFKPEPALEINAYDDILSIICNMAAVMERSPHAFKDMCEEDLRQHFLVQLNGQYEGQATGETFNYEGKTDILIRTEDRNIFIAECKFWKGEKAFLKTIDQLLGYVSWRDTKTAIILFNQNKELSLVLAQIPDAVRSHPNFKREKGQPSETQFRYLFHHNDDKNRELLLSVLVFDVPKEESADSKHYAG